MPSRFVLNYTVYINTIDRLDVSLSILSIACFQMFTHYINQCITMIDTIY